MTWLLQLKDMRSPKILIVRPVCRADSVAELLALLARERVPTYQAGAHELWPLTLQFDFDNYQLDCNKALQRLGLARLVLHPDHPEDGEVWLYGPAGDVSL